MWQYNGIMVREARFSWLQAATLIFIASFLSSNLTAQQTPQVGSGQDATIRVTVDSVLVPVVVRDARGRAIGGLTKNDFQVLDRGKLQKLSGFTIETRATAAPIPPSTAASVAAMPAAIAASDATPPRCTVLLFDDMHLSEGDLMRAKAVGMELLARPISTREAMAVVSMSGSNTGLAQNSNKLREAVAKLSVKNLYRKIGPECPNIGYAEADRIQNKHDGMAIEHAIANYLSCANSVGLTHDIAQRAIEGAAMRELEMGDQDTRNSLAFVGDLVRRMRSLPCRHTLVLISPGFLTMTAESMAEESILLDVAAQANVTISALDARGLYTTDIDASQRGARSQVELQNGMAQEYHRDTAEHSGNILGELADGTGGTYFHNSNDLQGGLQKLMAGPEFLYLLEFSLADVEHDGSFHGLSVKVSRAGASVQARRGYFAPKTTKESK
jgi:VWFA-related protein